MALYCFDGATPWLDDNPPKGQPADWRLRAVRAHGGIGVTVYIVGTPGGMRHATAADVAAARALSLGVVPNWERAADFFRTATLADCKAAGAEALAACRALGFPDDGSVGVPFSFDYQVPASGYAHATEQLLACGDGMGGHYQPIGYAQIDLINYWATHGLPGPHWLMGSTWRSSPLFTTAEVGSPHVAMVQSHTTGGGWLNSPITGTDVNTITQPTKLAAWWPDGSTYGGDMLTAAQATQLANAVRYSAAADARAQSLQGAVTALASGFTDALSRIASLQAELAALKQTGTLDLQPGTYPATLTVTPGAQS